MNEMDGMDGTVGTSVTSDRLDGIVLNVPSLSLILAMHSRMFTVTESRQNQRIIFYDTARSNRCQHIARRRVSNEAIRTLLQ